MSSSSSPSSDSRSSSERTKRVYGLDRLSELGEELDDMSVRLASLRGEVEALE